MIRPSLRFFLPVPIVFAVVLGRAGAAPAPSAPDSTPPAAPHDAGEGADTPAPITHEDLARGCAAYERERLVRAYRLHNGVPLDAPDEGVEHAFLVACADGFGGVEGAWDRVREFTTHPRLIASNDPFVQWILDYYKGFPTEAKESAAYFGTMIARLRDAGYPPVRIGGAVATAMDRADTLGNTELWLELAGASIDEGIRAASEPGLTTYGRRHIFAKFFEPAIEWPSGWHRPIERDVKAAEDIDPWVREIVLGSLALKRAWTERSGKSYSGLTDEEKYRLDKYMHIAGEHLTRAWEIDPACPEAPGKMIDVSMVTGAGDVGFREWFRRAISAQVDDALPYGRLRNALRPQWRGSPEALAQTVVDLNRPEFRGTEAVWQARFFFSSADGAWSSAGHPDRAYQDPELVHAMLELFQSLVDEDPGSATADRAHSWMAYVRHRAGDHPGAVASALAVRERFDTGIQRVADCLGLNIPAAILPHAIDAPELIERAEQLEEDGAWERAAEAWGELAGLIEPEADERVRLAVAHRARAAEHNAAFERGGWVDITFEEGLPGLVPLWGEWVPEDKNTVRLSTYSGDVALYIPIRTGDRHVFEASVTLPSRVVEHTRVGMVYGVGTRTTDRFDMHRNISVWPHGGQAVSGWYWSDKDHFIPIDPEQRTFRLRLVQDGVRVVVTVDGRPLHDGEMINVNPRSEPDTHVIGIGAWQVMSGGGSRDPVFSDVRVRALREGDLPDHEALEF